MNDEHFVERDYAYDAEYREAQERERTAFEFVHASSMVICDEDLTELRHEEAWLNEVLGDSNFVDCELDYYRQDLGYSATNLGLTNYGDFE